MDDVSSTLHDFNDFANYLYGFTILNSSATPCLYVMSKRTCEGHNGEIYTQLWAGYAAHLASQMDPKEIKKKIIIIDVGTGEFKRFICHIQHGKAVEKLSETPDKESPKDYKKNLKLLLDALVTEYEKTNEDGKKTTTTEDKIPREAYSGYLNLAGLVVDR